MLGRRIVENFRVVQHIPRTVKAWCVWGEPVRNEVWVNRDFMQ